MSTGPRKARSASQYRNEAHGRDESRVGMGNYCLNTALTQMARVSLKAKEQGGMVCRFWPHPYDERPDELQPGRIGDEPEQISPFIVRVATAEYIGGIDNGPSFSFNLYPFSDEMGRQSNPYNIFYWAAKNACDKGTFRGGRDWISRWNPLLKGGQGRGAQIPAPGASFFAQGVLYSNGLKSYVAADRRAPYGALEADPLVVFQLKRGVGVSIQQLFGIPKTAEQMAELEAKWRAKYAGKTVPELPKAQHYLHGDPVGVYSATQRRVTGGKFFCVYSPTTHTPGAGWTSSKDMPKSYTPAKAAVPQEVAISSVLRMPWGQITPDMSPEETAVALKKVRFWFDNPNDPTDKGILFFPSPEEQMIFIAKAYASVPKLVEYAFSENRELLTTDVVKILRQAKSVVVPGEDVLPEQPVPSQSDCAIVPTSDDEYVGDEAVQAGDQYETEVAEDLTTDPTLGEDLAGDPPVQDDQPAEPDEGDSLAEDSAPAEPETAAAQQEVPFEDPNVTVEDDDAAQLAEIERRIAAKSKKTTAAPGSAPSRKAAVSTSPTGKSETTPTATSTATPSNAPRTTASGTPTKTSRIPTAPTRPVSRK